MNKALARLIVGALSALPFSVSSLAADEDPVSDLIDQIVERQATVRSVLQRAEMTVLFQVNGEEEQMTQETMLVYQRPDRLVIESEMMILVSDGEALSVIFPAFEHFIQIPMAHGFAAALEEHGEYFGGAVLPDVAALLSDKPRELLTEFAEDITLTVLGDEERDGRMTWALNLIVEDDELDFAEEVKVWIDQETGLVSGMAAEVDLSAYPEAESVPGMPTRYALDYKVVHRSVNNEIDPDRFTYDTTGFTRVADFDELAEAMQGGMADVDLLDEEAPDFELTLLDGDVFRLSEQRGKVVLVDFWATWCPPCVESLPFLQEMYEDMGGEDVVFIGVSVDRAGMEDRVRNMLDRFGIEYLIGINGDGDIAMEYGAVSIPTMVLIDRDGVVRQQKVGFSPAGMEELKEELLRLAEGENAAEEE